MGSGGGVRGWSQGGGVRGWSQGVGSGGGVKEWASEYTCVAKVLAYIRKSQLNTFITHCTYIRRSKFDKTNKHIHHFDHKGKHSHHTQNVCIHKDRLLSFVDPALMGLEGLGQE